MVTQSDLCEKWSGTSSLFRVPFQTLMGTWRSSCVLHLVNKQVKCENTSPTADISEEPELTSMSSSDKLTPTSSNDKLTPKSSSDHLTKKWGKNWDKGKD